MNTMFRAKYGSLYEHYWPEIVYSDWKKQEKYIVTHIPVTWQTVTWCLSHVSAAHKLIFYICKVVKAWKSYLRCCALWSPKRSHLERSCHGASGTMVRWLATVKLFWKPEAEISQSSSAVLPPRSTSSYCFPSNVHKKKCSPSSKKRSNQRLHNFLANKKGQGVKTIEHLESPVFYVLCSYHQSVTWIHCQVYRFEPAMI